MDIATVAKQLHGCQYPFRLDKETKSQLKDAGIVIVYGVSDDIMSFAGAINDEVSCCDGGTALLDAEGLLDADAEDMSDEELRHYLDRKAKARTIHALWSDRAGPAWTYKTDIPCETFSVVEDGEIYCIGLVFSISALAPSASDNEIRETVEAMLSELPPEASKMRDYFETLARAGFSRSCVSPGAASERNSKGSSEPGQDEVSLPRRLLESTIGRLKAVETGGSVAMRDMSGSQLRDELGQALATPAKSAGCDEDLRLDLPRDLLPSTQALIVRFANALGDKLNGAQRKYGYGDAWADPNWMSECRQAMAEHLTKGDPRDVAAYCAFLWHHGESTTRVVHELYRQSNEIAASRRLQAAAAELISACRAADCLNKGSSPGFLLPEE